MLKKRWDLLGVGTAAVDDIFFIDKFPNPDEKIRIMEKDRRAGGQTATALVTAARHGARTAFFSYLGDDELSTFTIRELENENVDCSPIKRSAVCYPYHSFVLADNSGNRTILYLDEGNHDLNMEGFNPDWISESRMLLIDQNLPHTVLACVRLARAANIPIIADIESTTMPYLDEILSETDHLIVNLEFASKFSHSEQIDRMINSLKFSNQKALVITCGDQGCWLACPGDPVRHIPAYPIKAVDTTGCGDIFHGAYAAALLRGETIRQAVEIANITAGLKAASSGGRSGIPAMTVIDRLLTNNR